MNAMFEDEDYQLNEVSQVHVMIILRYLRYFLRLMENEFDEISHSMMEDI